MSDSSTTGTYTLYAMRASLYSGKARSYLIKQGIDYVEVVPGTRRFLEEIVPKIGRWIIAPIFLCKQASFGISSANCFTPKCTRHRTNAPVIIIMVACRRINVVQARAVR